MPLVLSRDLALATLASLGIDSKQHPVRSVSYCLNMKDLATINVEFLVPLEMVSDLDRELKVRINDRLGGKKC